MGGRRFRFGVLALDFVAGPAARLAGSAHEHDRQPRLGGSTTSQSSSGTVPRALVGAHMIFGARSSFRTFVGVDGEFGPPNAPDDNVRAMRFGSPSGPWVSRSVPRWGRNDHAAA